MKAVITPRTGNKPDVVSFLGVVLGAVILWTSSAPQARGVVLTNLVLADLRAALEQGGVVTLACDGALTLTNPVEVANDLVVDATGHDVTLSGGGRTRLFKVRPGTLLAITNVTLRDGSNSVGGAIYNEGTVLAHGCRFVNNRAVGAIGTNGLNGTNGTSSAVWAEVMPGGNGTPGGNGEDAKGGAILNLATLVLNRCGFQSNSVQAGMGGKGGGAGLGGERFGSVNSYQAAGQAGAGGAGGFGVGGAVASFGPAMIEACTFSNSSVMGGNGGLGGYGARYGASCAPVECRGSGGSAGSAGEARGGTVFNAANLTISNSSFVASSSRGGNGNRPGPMDVRYDDPLYDNPYSYRGNHTPGGLGLGGAICNESDCVIVSSTMTGNSALGGVGGDEICLSEFGGIGGDALGGALHNTGHAFVLNTTLATNFAIGAEYRKLCPPGQPTNYWYKPGWAGSNGHGYGNSIANLGTLEIANSILSGGTNLNCHGAITDLGHNLSSDASPLWTSGTSSNGVDPRLLPLADNGGPTWTMALRTGSPALNTADAALCPPTDQRGFPRPSGIGCDIGAYEGPGFATLGISLGGSGTNAIRWLAEAGRGYCLEQSTNLFDWVFCATNPPAGPGWRTNHFDGGGIRFLRLRAE